MAFVSRGVGDNVGSLSSKPPPGFTRPFIRGTRTHGDFLDNSSVGHRLRYCSLRDPTHAFCLLDLTIPLFGAPPAAASAAVCVDAYAPPRPRPRSLMRLSCPPPGNPGTMLLFGKHLRARCEA